MLLGQKSGTFKFHVRDPAREHLSSGERQDVSSSSIWALVLSRAVGTRNECKWTAKVFRVSLLFVKCREVCTAGVPFRLRSPFRTRAPRMCVCPAVQNTFRAAHFPPRVSPVYYTETRLRGGCLHVQYDTLLLQLQCPIYRTQPAFMKTFCSPDAPQQQEQHRHTRRRLLREGSGPDETVVFGSQPSSQ